MAARGYTGRMRSGMRIGAVDEAANNTVCAAAVVGVAADARTLLLLAYNAMGDAVYEAAHDAMDDVADKAAC